MDMIWEFINFTVNIVETVIIFKYVETFFVKKYTENKNWIWITIISILSYSICNISENFLWKFMLYIIILLFVVILFEGNIGKKLVVWLSLLIGVIAIENIAVLILMVLFNQPVIVFIDNTIFRLVAILISKISLYFLILGYVNRKEHRLLEVKNKSFVVTLVALFFVNIIVIMVLVLMVYKKVNTQDNLMNIMVFSCAMICILAICIYESMLKQNNEQMDIRLLSQQKDLQYKYVNAIETSIDEMKRIKHDFSNHMMCIMGYLETNKYSDLKKYLTKLFNPIENTDEIIVTGHPVISSMIYSKIIEAKKGNIKIKLATSFESLINIEDIDLCILIGNILDNAIEACMHVEEDKREIMLCIQTKCDWFLIDCINRTKNQIFVRKGSIIKTSKEDKVNHGIGLRNVESIVKKHKGEIAIDIIEGNYIIKVTMINDYVN
ncbi:MAG: hypothetical protein CVU84_14575 [Firmicutes bacterium HGW-Firmicutes-1]|jgi:sensor histidine kinase YesM|nr:MAG: hypothetical protein CVU84_14575 [Firmicutes bacterium HGW-Firmicutes-1]